MTPNSQKTVHINYTSTDDGTKYEGPFTIKRFTVRDTGAISVRKVQLNGGFHYEENGQGVDEFTDNLHYVIATVERGVVAAPGWWNVDTNYDMGLLNAIFAEVRNFQNTFRPNRGTSVTAQGQATTSAQGSSTPQPDTNGPGTPAAVVGAEVLAALEP